MAGISITREFGNRDRDGRKIFEDHAAIVAVKAVRNHIVTIEPIDDRLSVPPVKHPIPIGPVWKVDGPELIDDSPAEYREWIFGLLESADVMCGKQLWQWEAKSCS